MSDDSALPVLPARKAPNVRKRLMEYAVLLVIIGLIVGAAYYQEPISYYASMHQWDKAAPGTAVSEFLSAGKKGDQKTADSYLVPGEFHPLTRGGRWLGYFIATPAGKLEFDFSDMAPASGTKATETEFVNRGAGTARVTMPDSQGKPVAYRLEMRNGGWKVLEILGGKVGH